MSEPIKAWAIKERYILCSTIADSELCAWHRFCWPFNRTFKTTTQTEETAAPYKADGYRAVKVEIREVEE